MIRDVIIIGSNNFNELGIVRCFGKYGIKPDGILIIPKHKRKYSFIQRSRYWNKISFAETAEEALSILQNHYSGNPIRPVVISPMDKVVFLMDQNRSKYAGDFIFPSFQKSGNSIFHLAEKKVQADFARQNGFSMLPSTEIMLEHPEFPESFPVILKPCSGGEGKKENIILCKTEQEFSDGIKDLRKTGLSRILCQPYLETKQEYVVSGAVSPGCGFISFAILKTVRKSQLVWGFGAVSEIISDEKINEFVSHLTDMLSEKGFDGPFDIELFQTSDDEIIINEFNWRSSGSNFISHFTGDPPILHWYLGKCGCSFSHRIINKKTGFRMYETLETDLYLQGKISFREMISDFRKTDVFSLWDPADPYPVLIPYLSILKKILFKWFSRKRI